MRRGILFLLHFLCGGFLFCQNAGERTGTGGEAAEQLFLLIAEEYERTGEENPADLGQILEELLENPVRINSASVGMLESIPLFTSFMATSVREYIKDFGEIMSLYELAAVPGFDNRISAILAPMLDFSPRNGFESQGFLKSLSDGRSQFLVRGSGYLERQKGYTPVSAEEWQENNNSRYLYPPGKLYAQYKFSVPGKLRFALTTERDAGEPFGDYIGASLQLENAGVIQSAVAGDFTAKFGQGLVLWNSSSLFSSPAGSSFARYGTGISAYTSADENIGLRGLAAMLRKGSITLSLLFSSRERDARIADGGYTSLLNTGLHNTTLSLSRRRSLGVTVAGGNLAFSGERVRVGTTFSLYSYSHPYTGKDSLLLSRQSRFGNKGGNLGADIYFMTGRTRFFSEIATDIGGSVAALGGFVFSPSSRFSLSGLLRGYPEDYTSPFGGAVSVNGRMRGEMGINLSADYISASGNRYSAWIEWLKGKGSSRWGAEAVFLRREYNSLSVRVASREGGASLRVSSVLRLTRTLSLSSRGEISAAKLDEETAGAGWLFLAETIFRSRKGVFDCSARFTLFNTPRWNLRIYAYERDVLYGYSVPLFYGNGLRWYINMHAQPLRGVDVWFKFTRVWYRDREKTGEGLDQMPGPSSTELKAEVRFRF